MKYNYFESIDVSSNIDNAIEEGINKAITEKKKKRARTIAITSILSIAIFASTLLYNDEVSANVKQTFWSIANYLGLDTDLDEYKTIISQPITNNGYTVTINEIIIDGKELTVSSTIKSDDKPFDGFPQLSTSIYIEGERLSSNQNGVAESVDEFTINSVDTYFLEKDVSGNVNIRIDYSGMQILNEYGDERVSGSWSFNFTTDADALVKDTVTIDLNEKLELENGDSVTLKKYIINSLGTKIEFQESNGTTGYRMKLVGSDNLGNSIEFYTSYSNNGYGVFKLENTSGNLDKDATQLRLYLYGEESYSEENWEKIGEEININIK